MTQSTNFGFLKDHDPLLLQLATTAESAFVPDPNTTLLKLRQLGEALAQDIAFRVGVEVEKRSTQLELLRNVQREVNLPRCIFWPIPITRTGLIRSSVLEHSDHPFWFYPITFTGFPESVIGIQNG